MNRALLCLASAALLGACRAPAPVVDRTAFDAERGRLLYENTCGACHTTQPHWREQRLVRDWNGLLQQVTRWQGIAGQNWGRSEIGDVASYLNRRFYKLPCDEPGCASSPG